MWRRSRVQLHRHIVIPWRKASKHHSLGNPIGWEKLRRAESRPTGGGLSQVNSWVSEEPVRAGRPMLRLGLHLPTFELEEAG